MKTDNFEKWFDQSITKLMTEEDAGFTSAATGIQQDDIFADDSDVPNGADSIETPPNNEEAQLQTTEKDEKTKMYGELLAALYRSMDATHKSMQTSIKACEQIITLDTQPEIVATTNNLMVELEDMADFYQRILWVYKDVNPNAVIEPTAPKEEEEEQAPVEEPVTPEELEEKPEEETE